MRMSGISAVFEHRLIIVQLAERLALCERQVSRLVRRYETSSPARLVSGRRGQPSNRKLSIDVRARAMGHIRALRRLGPT